MNDAEFAAAIQDVCKRGATISTVKCFVESIRRDEREKWGDLFLSLDEREACSVTCARLILGRSNVKATGSAPTDLQGGTEP